MKCLKCKTDLPNEALFCLLCGVPQKTEMLKNYYPLIGGIDDIFHNDFFQLSQISFQSDETPIMVSDWSYSHYGGNPYFGYLVVTDRRYILVSFEKSESGRAIIETGMQVNKIIRPISLPLSDSEIKSRYIATIPFSYVTSIHRVECSAMDDPFIMSKVFLFLINTPEENELAFGTRFFVYSRDKAEKFQKTVLHYNSSVKYSYKVLPS